MTSALGLRDEEWLAARVRVMPSGCHEWKKCRTPDGYGDFSFLTSDRRRRHGLANRLALELRLGRPLLPGMCALHTCDNPPCCNAEHLFEGTRAENNLDRDAKGRSVHLAGEANGSAKLTRSDVDAIRAALSIGETGVSLAERYGVTPQLISMIKNRRIWNV